MKVRTSPQRLVVVAAPKNSALTLSSLKNAASSMSSDGPRSALILYDSDVAKVTDIKRLANEAGQIDVAGGGNLETETQEIPVINDLMEQDLPYMPREGDCILVPAMQLHIALLLERLAWAAKYMGVQTAYLCHTEPDGQSVEWKIVGHNPEGGFAVDTITLPKSSHDSLEWILSDSRATYSPATRFVDSKVEEFVDLEERSYDGETVTYALLGLVGAEPVEEDNIGRMVGSAFEAIAGHCFDEQDSIASVVINIEFDGRAKIFGKTRKREEDVIALTERGNLIYASCKFKGRSGSAIRSPHKITASMQEEVSRVKSLVLPINFPQERIKRMIITTTPAMQLAGETGEVIVTNLAGLSGSLKHL
jgi:hypothetical protein